MPSQATTTEDPNLLSLHVASETMRWRILNALAKGPKTASELAEELETSPQHINWHATKLEEVKLIATKRVDPEAGGMKIKEFHLVPREWTIRITAKGAIVSAKSIKA